MRKARQGVAAAAFSSAPWFAALFLALPSAAQAGDEIVDAPRQAREIHDRDTPAVPTAIDETDEVAALEGIRIALTEVGDGGSYVWHRRDGRLSGMAQPTSSFKDAAGQPCRHLVVTLNAFDRSKKVEGIACRVSGGRWQLTG